MAQVHCPGCRSALQVPEHAAGRWARCPSCNKRFQVPNPEELFEETVCAWIEFDVEKELEQRGDMDATAVTHRSSTVSSAGAPAAVAASVVAPGPSNTVAKPISAPSVKSVEALAAVHVVRPTPSAAAPPPIFHPNVSAAPPAEIEPMSAAPAPPQPVVVVPPVAAVSAPAAAPPTPFPSQAFHIPVSAGTGGRPNLVVLEVSQNGVRINFDSAWLEHLGFRASLPIRGVFSGSANPADLRARPMVFADRSGGVIRSPVELETRYEQTIPAKWTMRDLIKAMGLIEGLPRPFHYPMPYFVDTHHLNHSLQCTTRKRGDGGITCEVLVPNFLCALEWLRNVNGVCGPEYEALEHELALIQSDTWSRLSELCRQRLGVWCHFQPRERFVLYLTDADFGQHDSGLGGIVLTDRRLIYHKFHHSGQIDLAEQGILHLKLQESFVLLSYEGASTMDSPGHRQRLVKLHPQDIPVLIDTMTLFPTIQVIGPN